MEDYLVIDKAALAASLAELDDADEPERSNFEKEPTEKKAPPAVQVRKRKGDGRKRRQVRPP